MEPSQVYGVEFRACPQSTLAPAAYRDSAYVRVGAMGVFYRHHWEDGRVVQPEPTGCREFANVRLAEDPAGREADIARALARLPRHACETILEVELQDQVFKGIPAIDLELSAE